MARILDGAKIPHYKHTHDSVSQAMPLPKTVEISMSQHIGSPCVPLVKKGDRVKVGQLIGDSEEYFSSPIHSSVSGEVEKIGEITLHNGGKAQSIIIKTDGEQTASENTSPPTIDSRESFIKAVRDSGMVGLGGAGFPTHVKFNPENLDEVHTLIVNASECEPYITSDYRTIIEQTEELFLGITTIMEQLEIARCIIGIEEIMPGAIAVLEEMVPNYKGVEIAVLQSLYPQGAEKVIIHNTMDGLVVKEGQLPADVGTIVVNVSTVAELGEFFKTGMPLVKRRVTVDGGAIAEAKNVMVPVGTAINDVASFCGGYKESPAKILMGGPMMGIAVSDENQPIIKNNNALTFMSHSEATLHVETPCMRCGDCMRACPMRLMPFRMKSSTENENTEMLEKLKVNLCIECGCCSYVCPARQELVQAHRRGKSLLKQAKNNNDNKGA